MARRPRQRGSPQDIMNGGSRFWCGSWLRLLSGCGPPRRTARPLGRRNEGVRRHAETRTQALHHRHAQFFFAAQDLTHPARRSEDWNHLCPRETVLVHEMQDQFSRARRVPGPLAVLVGRNQARLSLEPGNISAVLGVPQPINEGTRACEFRVAVDHDQGGIHHTVSASMLSYSAWLPKNRIARTLA